MGFLKISLAAALVVSLGACSGNANTTVSNTTEETPVATPAAAVQSASAATALPKFTVLDASGQSVDLQSFKGKKVFVNLWATWCPPCRAEMPAIDKLYQAAAKEKAQFVMISLDNNFETAKSFVQKTGFTAPIFYPASDLPDLFAVDGIPATFIFDEDGNLLEQHIGSENYNTAAYRKLFGAVQ